MQALNEYISKDGFRLRGISMSRIDGFSDVVFGFALTLLVVSLEVPKTFAALHETMRGFLPFAICFYFLIAVWYSHYKFFRRFGTHDLGTIAINATLLFVVLFYVYPLKFLFTFIVDVFTGAPSTHIDSYWQIKELMALYGVGFAAIYFLIAALYWNGLRQRLQLGLNRHEEALARFYAIDSAGVASFGIVSCLVALALPGRFAGLAGWIYALTGVFKQLYSRGAMKRLQQRRAALEHPSGN